MRLVSKAFILLQINDSAASVSRRTQGLAMETRQGMNVSLSHMAGRRTPQEI